MKRLLFLILTSGLLAWSCADLDLVPPSKASSENWNLTAEQLRISLNDMYNLEKWKLYDNHFADKRCDDWSQRNQIYEMTVGNIASTWSVNKWWDYTYQGIAGAIKVIEAIDAMPNPEDFLALRAEACFFRGYFYGRNIIVYGPVPFYTTSITPEEAMELERTDIETIKEQVYEDLDYAIDYLPEENAGAGAWRVNKYVAQALKARFALFMKDYQIARDECALLMSSGKYKLYPDYGELFRQKGVNNGETIFARPRLYDIEYQSYISYIPSCAGGHASAQPSWDLLAAYECTDGLSINESPLFDPHNPFKNRDPRCLETFVEPGTEHLGVIYDPNPTVLEVYDSWAGQMVVNRDCKPNNVYAAFASTALRKGAQREWREHQYNENPIIIIRYADILLMYAEAKIELNEIDQSTLDAINDVRARAYKVSRDQTDKYPAITTKDQTKLRRILRNERRIEFAWENRRWWDLRRWGWLEKAYSHHNYGHLNADGLTKMYKAGNYYWPYAPKLDEDGFADFTKMHADGYIMLNVTHKYDPKVELFPIPNDEIITNPKLTQNPGY